MERERERERERVERWGKGKDRERRQGRRVIVLKGGYLSEHGGGWPGCPDRVSAWSET